MNDCIIQNSTFNTQQYVDWHCHLLPGLDDGAGNGAESLAIARILAEAGFSEVQCTPHSITGAFEAAPARVRRAVEKMQQSLTDEGISLRLNAGAEHYCDEFLTARLHDPLLLGESRLFLMEAPLQAPPELLARTAFQVASRGYTPLVAHPERCAILDHGQPETASRSLLSSMLRFARSRFSTPHSTLNTQHSKGREASLPDLLRSMGCRFQGNIGSFAGLYGEEVRRRASQLLRQGFYDCLGSDAHASRGLARWLRRGLLEVENLAGREALEALLSGAALRPAGGCAEQAAGLRTGAGGLGA